MTGRVYSCEFKHEANQVLDGFMGLIPIYQRASRNAGRNVEEVTEPLSEMYLKLSAS